MFVDFVFIHLWDFALGRILHWHRWNHHCVFVWEQITIVTHWVVDRGLGGGYRQYFQVPLKINLQCSNLVGTFIRSRTTMFNQGPPPGSPRRMSGTVIILQVWLQGQRGSWYTSIHARELKFGTQVKNHISWWFMIPRMTLSSKTPVRNHQHPPSMDFKDGEFLTHFY